MPKLNKQESKQVKQNRNKIQNKTKPKKTMIKMRSRNEDMRADTERA